MKIPFVQNVDLVYVYTVWDYYYTIAEMSGLGVSTVHAIVTQICASIVENLWQECITEHMPQSEEDFKGKKEDMNNMWQFPLFLLGCDRWMPHSNQVPTRWC